jgi:hypothetical protein
MNLLQQPTHAPRFGQHQTHKHQEVQQVQRLAQLVVEVPRKMSFLERTE